MNARRGFSCGGAADYVGDLTSTLDFSSPNYTFPALPDTANYTRQATEACGKYPPPRVPTDQTMPRQEAGTRPSRALPYVLHASASVAPGSSSSSTGRRFEPVRSRRAPAWCFAQVM